MSARDHSVIPSRIDGEGLLSWKSRHTDAKTRPFAVAESLAVYAARDDSRQADRFCQAV